MTMRIVECEYVIMLQANCPACDELYFFGTEEIKEPVVCDVCNCNFALNAPEEEEGELIFELDI
jgi:hypothetical protein